MDTTIEGALKMLEGNKHKKSTAETMLEFAEAYHQKKCKKLPKEIIVQNLERRGKKIAHDNNIFKRKNWDNAVQVITENYK